jgi:hypothetical protein
MKSRRHKQKQATRRIRRDYTQNGGRAEMQRPGPFDNDGHRLFLGSGGAQIWGPMVDRYLASRPAG